MTETSETSGTSVATVTSETWKTSVATVTSGWAGIREKEDEDCRDEGEIEEGGGIGEKIIEDNGQG